MKEGKSNNSIQLTLPALRLVRAADFYVRQTEDETILPVTTKGGKNGK